MGFWRQWNEQSTAWWRVFPIKMWNELEGRCRSVGRRQSGHPAKSTHKVAVGASSFSMLFVLLVLKLQLLLHSKFHLLLLVRWKFILFGGHVGVLFWCCFLVFFLFFFNFNVHVSEGFLFHRLNSNYACSSFSDCVGAFWWQSVVS